MPRSRLVGRLEEGLRRVHKLALVSAPAGFGKTTLLAEFAARCDGLVAWISLDGDDNDPATFWAYVVSALQTVYPDVGSEALAALESPQPPPVKALLTGLVNELVATTRQVVLVLDDYHAISNRAIHEGLTFLLDHQPGQLHLVLSTRADPPQPVARLRGRGQLTELRADDLRFTVGEAAAFLNEVMGLDLLPEDVTALEARTEGWIVGLQLAALSMQGREDVREFVTAFTGGHHYILEYLTEEVLQRQPEPVRQFLLQTSILERMCGPLCVRVVGREDGEGLLEQVQRANLFVVPLDDEHRWYRYHHLFADLLGNLLRQEKAMDEEAVAELHRRASAWYEDNGMLNDGIKHALQADDHRRAARLIEQAMQATISRGRVTTLVRWSEALRRKRRWPDPGCGCTRHGVGS